jgi:hypothetical protein
VLFAENQARMLLVLHTVLAAALVAVSTHLVVWMRGFPKGRFQRLRGVRKLSIISAALFTLTLVVGNLLYPVYKVRVRAEYLDHPSAITHDQEQRQTAHTRVAAQYADSAGAVHEGDADTALERIAARDGVAAPALAPSSEQVARAVKAARWFDVKEHWVAFGMIMAIGCAVLSLIWKPEREYRAIASIAFLMAVAAALTTWLGALVGILVSSYRAVG